MKINKDNVIGAIVMLLIVGVITWGVVITVKIDRVAQAHDNLVTIMSPVINQIQQQAAMQRAQQPQPQGPRQSAMPAQVQPAKPEVKAEK